MQFGDAQEVVPEVLDVLPKRLDEEGKQLGQSVLDHKSRWSCPSAPAWSDRWSCYRACRPWLAYCVRCTRLSADTRVTHQAQHCRALQRPEARASTQPVPCVARCRGRVRTRSCAAAEKMDSTRCGHVSRSSSDGTQVNRIKTSMMSTVCRTGRRNLLRRLALIVSQMLVITSRTKQSA